ncbi:olfactory receptor 10D3-like, partial [Emydura macquarii macquarii]|uniref:olfactory receptor 10D3-like n=1 Tax=Emydura macquarii macquarii TaxID=1129001 RepID=UPI00352B6536
MTPSCMEMENHTVVLEFILLCIPNTKGQETILFVIFLAFYLCTLLGNLLILSAILVNSHLHTPMYFFLCNLSMVDLGFASIIPLNCWYVAICHLLSYLIIMNWRVCAILAASTWVTNSFHATILTSLTFTLSYSGLRVSYIIKTVSFTNIGMVPMTCFLLILMSYIRIAASVPSLSNVLATPNQVFCNVVTLMLNPVMYTLRN